MRADKPLVSRCMIQPPSNETYRPVYRVYLLCIIVQSVSLNAVRNAKSPPGGTCGLWPSAALVGLSVTSCSTGAAVIDE